MDILLNKVKDEEREILFRLLQYSLFEESENDLNEMNENALFDYSYFDNYFTDDDRDAYFIIENQTNKLLGFVMVNEHVQMCYKGHSIAEFLIIPKYRKRGIGKKVAFEIFDKYLGNWEIKPSFNSVKAYSFWKKTVVDYTNNNFEYKENIFIFNNSIKR